MATTPDCALQRTRPAAPASGIIKVTLGGPGPLSLVVRRRGADAMARGGWRLTRGGEVLAVLRPDGRSLVPELDGHFTVEAAYTTTPAFEPVRHLFEREAQLLDVDSEPENNEWVAIWDELKAPGLFVESADGRERFDILWIHFKYGRAWWFPLGNSPLTIMRNDPA